jgi:hypothetical protein
VLMHMFICTFSHFQKSNPYETPILIPGRAPLKYA